jgi:uncharacterized membrane protein YbhN (UPF0104 family)
MMPGMRYVLTGGRIALGVALLWYLGRSGAIEWPALLGLVRAWPITLLAFLLLFADVVVTASRLTVLMRARRIDLSIAGSTRLALIGNFFSSCLPGSAGGDVVRIYYATEGQRGRRTEVATIILLDRAVGLFALLVWPLLVVPFAPQLLAGVTAVGQLLTGAGVFAAVLLAGFIAACSSWLMGRLFGPLLARLPFGNHAADVLQTIHEYRRHPKALLAALGISLLAHTMSVGVTLLCIAAAGQSGVTWSMAVLIPVGHLANTVPLTPGGLGIGEAAFDTLFSMAGLTGGAEGLLGWRLLTIVISLAGLVFYLQGRRKVLHPARADAGTSEGLGSLAPVSGVPRPRQAD